MKLRRRAHSCARLQKVLAALVVALAIVPAAAQSPLTLSEAQRRAVERSQMLVAYSAAAAAAREMAVAAGQLPDPVATLGVNNLPINGPNAWSFTADFMTMRSVGVMQEFTRSEKREARAERFEREADKSAAERTLTLANIQRDTALAWLDRYYAEAQTAVVNDQLTQAAFIAGQGTSLELVTASEAHRQAELNLALREYDVVTSRLNTIFALVSCP